MTNGFYSSKAAVYVDVANVARNGGYGMRYDVLREFACRGAAEPIRLNAYVVYDAERGADDPEYRKAQEGFFAQLRDFGYKVVQKTVRWYTDEDGNRYGKADADLDMAVDAILPSEHIDRVLLATGDGDFVRVVQALQGRGCRVEVLAFDNVSSDLKREADSFYSGYLVPHLLPVVAPRPLPAWGELGSRVRGCCFHHTGKGYGFLRFLRHISPELWRTDSRHPDSPYESVFFHDSQLPENVSYTELPSRNLIFEFDLAKAENGQEGMQAKNMTLMGVPGARRRAQLPPGA